MKKDLFEIRVLAAYKPLPLFHKKGSQQETVQAFSAWINRRFTSREGGEITIKFSKVKEATA